jgi:hypothetical protein
MGTRRGRAGTVGEVSTHSSCSLYGEDNSRFLSWMVKGCLGLDQKKGGPFLFVLISPFSEFEIEGEGRKQWFEILKM